MTVSCFDTVSEDQYSEIDDKEEEYYDDDDRESFLYFHSFLHALANLYIFDFGFLSAYKMGGEKINLCAFTEHFWSYWEHYPELGVLKPLGENLCKGHEIMSCKELYWHSYRKQKCGGSRQHKILRCYLKHFYGDVQQSKMNGTWCQVEDKYDVSFKNNIFKFCVPR